LSDADIENLAAGVRVEQGGRVENEVATGKKVKSYINSLGKGAQISSKRQTKIKQLTVKVNSQVGHQYK
jgi:hypothetical protein